MTDDPFFSPVHTLACSLHDHPPVSVHDLLDAYATFTNRVTSHLLQTDIVFLETHKDNLVRALRRDVRRALIHPLDHISFGGVSDASLLSHHALRALATVFRYPTFYSVFSEHDLSSMFDDVLEISLPGPDQTRMLPLSLYALNSHCLPWAVLGPRRDVIFSVLRQSLDDTRQHADIVLDGLKATSHTIQHHPSAFLLPLSPLLPRVIANAFCESYEHRLQASITLGKFANALVSESVLSLTKWQTFSNHTVSFLESYCALVAFEDTGFSRSIRAAFSNELSSHPPTWTPAVLASLIILCGPTLYKKPMVLRFILQSLAMTLTHKRSVMRALHPHVWRCLVWTFSRMLLGAETVEPAVTSLAFHAIKQEVNGGIGIALASVILSDRVSLTRSHERDERVSQALSIIMTMVQTGCKHTRREAFMFLQAFFNDTQVRHQITQNMYEMPASILLNGAIIGAEWDSLPSIVHSIPKVSFTVDWLEEAEIARYCKTLLETWKHFAIKIGADELNSSLVGVWRAILLVYSRQLRSGHHIRTTEVLRSSAETIIEFLPPAPLPESHPDWGSWSVHDQLCRLSFIDELWSAMQQAFVSFSLEESAELILTSILRYRFHALDVDVQTLWGRLCASLMVTASQSFLRDMHDLAAPHLVIRSHRELWGVVATSFSSKSAFEWKELVKFLAIPICSWVLSSPELEAYETVLRKAIIASRDHTIVAEFLQSFQGREVENWESIMPVLGSILTSTHEHGISPSDEFLSVLNASLTVSYGRARHSPEGLAQSLKLLNSVRYVIVSDPARVIHTLHTLRSSLSLWIEDRAEVMSDDEFNSVAVPLYCETLKTLEALPLSVQSLQDTEDFIGSAFSRIPTPATAPFAFETFWRVTYHGRSEFSNVLPPKIKSCLICFVSAYGGDLADGLSLTPEGQSESINDHSQAPFPVACLHQESGEHDPQATHAGARPDANDMEDATFLEDSVLEPTVLRQLREYSSRMDEDEPEGSVMRVSSVSPRSAIPSTPFPKKSIPVPRCAHQKRKLSESDAGPRKRSRTARAALRAARKFESEPATRDVTPIDVPRTNSVPLRKRTAFDGVQVPTFHAVRRSQKGVEEADASRDAVSAEQGLVSTPKTRSSRARRRSKTSPPALPSSLGSDEDSFDRDVTSVGRVRCALTLSSSEIDVDQSLMVSSPRVRMPRSTSAYVAMSSRSPRRSEPDDEPDRAPGSSWPRAVSQSDISPSAPPRPCLRRAKTTSARLDALRDVYSAVADGASQIPLSELVQATRLVHQIGAVLTDQMGKKMGDP